jgi:hypothetical protein
VGSGLTDEQKSVIIGTLLGDGCIEKRKKNPRLRIDHANAQKEYVFWKYGILKNIATRPPHILYERDKRSGKVGIRWYFATHADAELHWYYELFYQNKIKVIREDIIDHFTHPRSLAVWLMDDGYKRNDCDAVRFSTDCFSYEEQEILQKCLFRNFGICSKLHRKGTAWNIYVPSSEMDKMRALCVPYIIPVMQYKLPPRNDLIRHPADRIVAFQPL